MTRSSGPTQPGSGRLRRTLTGTGEPGSASSSSTSHTTADPPSEATSTERGRSPPATRSIPASSERDDGLADLGPGRGQRPRSVWRESRAAMASSLSMRCSSRKGAIGAACRSGRLAGFVDEQDGHAVVDAVLQAALGVGAVQLRPGRPVASASSRAAGGQRRISRSHGSICGLPVLARSSAFSSHQGEDIVPHPLHGRPVGGLDVEPQQRFGVGRAQVEPPHRVAVRCPRGSR